MGAENSPLIEVKNLSVSLPDMAHKPLFGAAPQIHILKNLSFNIERGQVLGIVGGSGSGKSTLGRTILRLIEPTKGQVLFDGTDISHKSAKDLRALRKKFQMIFQDPMSSLNPRRQVGGIVAGPMRIHGMDNIKQRANKALEMVGLPTSFAKRYPHELSGGQRQRVGIARAIALEPEFILADEIVSGLDVSSQAQVLILLEDLVKSLGLTLAFISHDMSVIRRLCSQVLVLNHGEIAELSPATEIFEAPKSDYTRQLIDAIPLPDPDQAGWHNASHRLELQ